MSHILDALRKAQDEKTGTQQKSVVGGEALIARRSGNRWGGMTQRVWIMAGSGVVLLAVVGWLLYGPSKKPAAERPVAVQSAQPSQPQPAVAPSVAPQPSAPAAGQTPLQQLPAPPLPPPPAAVAVPSPAAQAPASVPPKQPDESEEETASRSRRNRRSAERGGPATGVVQAPPANISAAPTAPAAPAATQSAAPAAPVVAGTPEGVKLTGIAWQENRKMRRAVVNDVLVGEGALVAGVKVVEIRPAAVRFEKNGTVFEVALPR